MGIILRRRLLASTLLAGATFAQPGFAQDVVTNTQEETADVGDAAARLCVDNPNSPQCAAEGEAIVVTGSRIASPTLSSASPLQIVDAQDIDDSGVVNLQEVLLENPAFGTPTISRTNSGFATSSAGTATVDLRNLNVNRTLVLVNGRRFVAGIPTSATVDLNTIPTQFIERVDILTGGASSIYGSDAVAGVVNIIYKDDFEGVELQGQLGVSERGDDVRKQANLIMGANFAEGRGNVTLHLGYSDQGIVNSRNRPNLDAELDQISCRFGNTAGVRASPSCDDDTATGNNPFQAFRPFLSSFVPGGTFFYGPGFSRTSLIGPGGQLMTPNTNGTVGGVPGSVTPTGFNRSTFRIIAIPTERYLAALRGNYEISDDISVFVEGTFAKTKVFSRREPFPLSSFNIFPGTFGQYNVETRLADGTIARNPFIQDAIFNNAVDTDADGLRDVYFTRRLADIGPRSEEVDRNTFRVLAGLEGTVFSDWRWDAFYAYGETVESQTGTGQVNVLNFANALDVITDVDDINNNGSRTDAICASVQARAQGCVPANVFGGPNSISPASATYINALSTLNSRTSQKLAGANLSGNLFDPWGAGPVGLAVGVEYRKEFSQAINDPLTVAGLNGGNALPSIRGSFDVVEGYAELAVPLLSDRPFFDTLTARAALRVSDYSTVGTTYSYNAGLEWAPVPDVRFRGVYARATRAPNIGELFTAPSQTFPPGLQDPCEGVTATADSPFGGQGALCRADPGVAANIAANGSFVLTQADAQGISGFTSGNPNLREEKADTFTLGAVINPRSISWLRNFAFTVDYYNIKIDNAINTTGRQVILNECFVTGNPLFCGFIIRRPFAQGAASAGSLNFVNSAPVNSQTEKQEGIDVTVSFRQNLEDLGLFGNLNARVAWTHVFKALQVPLPGAQEDSFNREVGAPRNKVFGTVSWETDRWGITWRQTYLSAVYLDDQTTGAIPGEDGSEEFRVPDSSEMYSDLQLRFMPGDNYEFYLGVDNLFDNDPPPIISGLPGNTTGTETDASLYDPIGRRFYAGARLKF